MSEAPTSRADGDPRWLSCVRWSGSGLLALGAHCAALLPFLWIALSLRQPVPVVFPIELIRLPAGAPSPFAREPEAPAPAAAAPVLAPPAASAPPAVPLPPPPRRKPEPPSAPDAIEHAQQSAPVPPVAAPSELPAQTPTDPEPAQDVAMTAVAREDPVPPLVPDGVPSVESEAEAEVSPPPRPGPDWKAGLVGRLQRYKRYPPDARQLGQEGTTYVRFTMDRRGLVVDSKLVLSSGHLALDEEAINLPHRSEPLPTPPAGVGGDRIEIVVPVEFHLH